MKLRNTKFKFNNFVEVERMLQFLDMKEVTTERQKKNGTREFELPIKDSYTGRKIRVASFSTGYVRNQNSASSNYQLNKQIDGKPEYFKLPNGDYRKYTGKVRVLIPNEQDRLEYLISYCLKNYYIKHANFVADGEYVPKWRHEHELRQSREKDRVGDVSVTVNGQRYKVI